MELLPMDTYLTLALVAAAAIWLLARTLRRPRPGGCASGCEGCPAARFHGTGAASCHDARALPSRDDARR